MSKLSKAQQHIVDKMREGYTLVCHGGNFWCFRGPNGERMPDVGLTRVVNALTYKGVIFEEHGVYRLTEQYKNEQK